MKRHLLAALVVAMVPAFANFAPSESGMANENASTGTSDSDGPATVGSTAILGLVFGATAHAQSPPAKRPKKRRRKKKPVPPVEEREHDKDQDAQTASEATSGEAPPSRNAAEVDTTSSNHVEPNVSAVAPTPQVEDQPAAAKPSEPAPAPVLSGVHLAAFVAVSDIPLLFPAVTIDALLIGLGIGLKYDANGLLGPTGARTTDKLAFGTNLYLSYGVINKAPFLLHPEITWYTSFAPGDPLSINVISAGVGFTVVPFPAPLCLGAAWNARLTLTKGAEPVFDLFTPGLRIGYVLN